MKKLIIFSFYLILVSGQNSYICPYEEDIKPCVCKTGIDRKPWITCENLKSLEQLEMVLKNMENLAVSNFYLMNSNLGNLKAEIFNHNIAIESLTILDTNITKLSESRNRPPFVGLESTLQYLEIKNSLTNANSPLSGVSFSHLKKLTLLQLEGNLMPTIGNDVFESGPYGLRELHLLNTKTATVGSHVFDSLENIKSISLTGGSVSKVTRDMFPMPAEALNAIDLNNNNLRTLPKDIFTNMPSLQEVYLEKNYFTTIEEVIWAPVWGQLQHVFLYENPLNCNGSIKWIYKYRMPEYVKGNCRLPFKLRGRELSNLTLSDFP